MKTIFDEYLGRNLGNGASSKFKIPDSCDLNDMLERARNLELVDEISVTSNLVICKPKMDLLAKHTINDVLKFLEEASVNTKSPQGTHDLVLFSVPPPGVPFTSSDLRVIFSASYISSMKKALNLKVQTRPVYSLDLNCGYLVLGAQKFGLPTDSSLLDMETLTRKALADSDITEQQARTVFLNLGENEIWKSILPMWKRTIQDWIDSNKLSLDFREVVFNDGHLDFKDNECTVVFADKLFQKFDVYRKSHKLMKFVCVGSSNLPLQSLSKCFTATQEFLIRSANVDLDSDMEIIKSHNLAHSLYKFQIFGAKMQSKLSYNGGILENQDSTIGIALQYTFARCCGIQRYIDGNLEWNSSLDACPDLSTLSLTPKVFDLIELIGLFPKIFEASITNPCKLTAYACRLGKMVSSQYYHLRIKGEPLEIQKARWAVLFTAKRILEVVFQQFSVPLVTEI